MSTYTIEISESQRCQIFWALCQIGHDSDLTLSLSNLYERYARTYTIDITGSQWEVIVRAVGAVHLLLDDEYLLPMFRDLPKIEAESPGCVHGLCW